MFHTHSKGHRRSGGIWSVLLLFYHGARSRFGMNTCKADCTNNPNSKGISCQGGMVFWNLGRPCQWNILLYSCDHLFTRCYLWLSHWLFTILGGLWHASHPLGAPVEFEASSSYSPLEAEQSFELLHRQLSVRCGSELALRLRRGRQPARTLMCQVG